MVSADDTGKSMATVYHVILENFPTVPPLPLLSKTLEEAATGHVCLSGKNQYSTGISTASTIIVGHVPLE